MDKPNSVIAKKIGNALMKDAEMGETANRLLGPGGRLGTEAVKKLMGGLWVGGTLYLTESAVEFHPNGLNKRIHKDPEQLSVILPLRSIKSVTPRFGLVTQIIDLKTPIGTLSVRCFGAEGFARKIETARGA